MGAAMASRAQATASVLPWWLQCTGPIRTSRLARQMLVLWKAPEKLGHETHGSTFSLCRREQSQDFSFAHTVLSKDKDQWQLPA